MRKHPLPTAPKTLAVLRHLHRGHKLTLFTAITRLGVGALSQEVGRLKRLGWPVRSRTIKRGASRFSEYSL
jgi:hypothetical protein